MKKINADLKNIVTVDREDIHYDADTALDHTYDTEIRNHRNRRAKLDHFFEYAVHPLCLLLIFIFTLIVFSIFRFLGIFTYQRRVKKPLIIFGWRFVI
jgi:hypothetical protein